MSPNWTQDPRAIELLASCAANPPRLVRHDKYYIQTVDTWLTYEGRRPDALAAIRNEYGDRALAKADAGDRDDMLAWCRQPDVTAAIGDAIDAASTREPRSVDFRRVDGSGAGCYVARWQFDRALADGSLVREAA